MRMWSRKFDRHFSSAVLWSRMMFYLRWTSAVFLAFGLFVLSDRAEAGMPAGTIEEPYLGVVLLSVPPQPAKRFDVSLMAQKKGLEKLKKAFGLIAKNSSFSMGQIERLKQAGQVAIVYDPNYPKRTLDKIVAASFFPNYFDENSKDPSKKIFLTVVGRHGIKWPLKELAAVLVHELVGHGVQRLEGRIKGARKLDTECEAWLYEELAYQDFKMNKLSKEMVQFRQELERIHCSDFKTYMRKVTPQHQALWDVLNPDVPRLLGYFKTYQKKQRTKRAGQEKSSATTSRSR